LNEFEGLMREVSERSFTSIAKHAGTTSQPAALKLRASTGSVHLIGIAGAGMRALASIMLDQGWTVSGSDLNVDSVKKLAARGAKIFTGHATGNVPLDAQKVIYSDAIPPDNLERRAAERFNLNCTSYAEALAELTARSRTLAVAGTHGKSTVTAMAAEILVRAGMNPTVICGAAPVRGGGQGIGELGGRNGQSGLALVEACEFRENFLRLTPQVAVLLSIEPDHFDCYPSAEKLHEAFAQFIARTPDDGLIIAAHESAIANKIANASGRNVVTFGFADEADWRATNVEHSRGKYRFDLVRHGRRLTRVVLTVAGQHQISNALAAAALARHCGASIQNIALGLAAFRGLRRRLELRGMWQGVPWIDDYAHHPTEVQAALNAVRQLYPRRRIVCVFQPHQASRLTALLDELAVSLHNADRIAVAETFRAREPERKQGEASAADLADILRACRASVLDGHDPRQIATQLSTELQPGDVLVTMGAGDIGKIFREFHDGLRRDRAAA
jgi:UDP-N-acetylmuramate--alanine ligase